MAGLTREELAGLADVSLPTIVKIEGGTKKVSLEYVDRVQTALERAGLEFYGDGDVKGEGVRFASRKKREKPKDL
jgi:transcriptional regulator with XRE-family HTH domain